MHSMKRNCRDSRIDCKDGLGTRKELLWDQDYPKWEQFHRFLVLTSWKQYLEAAIDIVGHALSKIAKDGSTNANLFLASPWFCFNLASVNALAVVTRTMISSEALSSIGEISFSSHVVPSDSARSIIASKHAIDANANAIRDVCCWSFGKAARTWHIPMLVSFLSSKLNNFPPRLHAANVASHPAATDVAKIGS